MTRRTILIAVTALVLIGGAFLLLKRDPRTESAGEKMMNADVPVSVSIARKQKLATNMSFAGTISANNDVNVISETQGVVRKVHFGVGAHVGAGAVLVEVEDGIPRSTMSTAEISFQKARRDFERTETLFQEGSSSPAQLDVARLALKAAENQLDIARRQLENTRIKSPIAGTVNSRFVNVGTMVQPGMPVANIVDITVLKVRVNVNERAAFQLRPGDLVAITTDVYPGHTFEAKVDNIASKADEAHTYPVEIILPNNARYPLKSGMFCLIGFRSITAGEAIAVPRIALVGSIKNASVFVIHGGLAIQQAIVIGQQTNESFEVLQGLQDGDTVVVSGQNNLVDHAKVTIVAAQ